MSSASPVVFSRPPGYDDRDNGGRRQRRRLRHSTPGQSVYEWVILVLVGLAPLLGVWLYGGVRTWSVGPLMACVFLGAALCALRYIRADQGPARRWSPGLLLLAVFVGYGFLLIPRSAVPYDSYMEALKVASFLGAYWVWTELAGVQGRWRWLMAGFLIVVTMMAWYAIIQHAHGARGVLILIRPDDYGMRASGAYFCPNHFANLLNLTIPFAVALAAAPSAGLPLRLLAGYSVLVALPPLYLTQSRSGWIGVVAGLAVTISLLGLRRSFRRCLSLLVITPLVSLVVGLGVWMVSPMVQERVAAALAGNVRLALWRDTLLMIREQPWLGWGPYSFRWVYPHFWHNMTSYLDPQFAHNDYLQLLAEYGVVGLVILVGAVLAGAIHLLRWVRRSDSTREACLIAGALGALAASAAHACFDYNFHIYGNAQVLVMLLGVTTGVLLSAQPALPPIRSVPLARARALGALLPLLLLVLTVRMVTTYAFSLQGDFARKKFEMEQAQQAYKTALRVEPRNWQAHLGLGHVWGSQAFWNRDAETRTQQVQLAKASYQQAMARNKWETQASFGLSRMYNVEGQTAQALELLQGAAARMPFHRDLQAQLGLQLRRMGRYQEALEVFQQVRKLGPSEMADLNIQSLKRLLAKAPPTP